MEEEETCMIITPLRFPAHLKPIIERLKAIKNKEDRDYIWLWLKIYCEENPPPKYRKAGKGRYRNKSSGSRWE